MTELKLTHAAFQALYGGARVIVTDDTLFPHVRPMAGEAFTLLLCDEAGAIRAAHEGPQAAGLPAMGAPLGLAAFVLRDSCTPVVQEWGAELLLAKSNRPFEILLLPADGEGLKDRLHDFMHGLQSRLLSDMTERASRLERQTLYLRQASERLMLELTAAKRVIDGIGYSDRTLVAEVPLGRRSVGPVGDVDTHHFSQILPADGLGVSAIGLHVVLPRGEPANGALRVALMRDADGKLLGEQTWAYGALPAGWIIMEMSGGGSNVFADVRLEVSWHDAEGGARRACPPLLGLSDIHGNHFGEDRTDLSLALRVFKSIGQPVLAPESLALVPAAPGLPLVLLPGQHPGSVGFYGGDARRKAVIADIGFEPFQYNDEEGWVQAHLASDGITGLSYTGTVPAGTERIDLTVSVPDQSGPEVIFHAFLTDSLDHIEARVAAVLKGGSAAAEGFDHASSIVGAGAEKSLSLVPSQGTDHQGQGPDRALLLVAKTLTGTLAHGWCRWSKAVFITAPGRHQGSYPPLLVPKAIADSPKKVIRTIKLPELGGMAQFLDGTERLMKLTDALGFCPMMMDENGGYLQTHPLQDTLSGAVLPALIAPGTHRLVAHAHTGHPDAPDFIYAALLVRQDVSDIAAVVRPAVAALKLGAGEVATGGNKADGLYWQAVRLSPGQEGRLELDFEEPLDAVYHLVLVARPVEAAISFGWCRWTTLGITCLEQTRRV